MAKIGIIICDNRAALCSGLNCFKAISSHSGAFARYDDAVEVAGYTTCGGCPGYRAKERAEGMIKYAGAETIHLGVCIYRSFPNPNNKSLKEIETELGQGRAIQRLNQDDFYVQNAKAIKSGQLPHICLFKEKMKKDIEMLGVEVIEGTHAIAPRSNVPR
ncbi:CGGC domain-containing protein [Chloroflexota bacterium]